MKIDDTEPIKLIKFYLRHPIIFLEVCGSIIKTIWQEIKIF